MGNIEKKQEDENKAKHFSAGKSGVDQIPPFALIELGNIFKYGEKKYGRDNWKKGLDYSEFYGSLLRHIYAWGDGQDNDNCDGSEGCAGESAEYCPKHSRLPHLAHALWNAICLMYYQRHGLGVDWRANEPPVRRLPAGEQVSSISPEEALKNWYRDYTHPIGICDKLIYQDSKERCVKILNHKGACA